MNVVRRLSKENALAPTGCFTLGVCPVIHGTEAPRMAAELALFAARNTKGKVLVIETNRGAPILAECFGFGVKSAGLAEMLLPPPFNRFDAVHPTFLPNLFVLPAGKFNETPASVQLEWVHRTLSPHFQAIVMELPPMGEFRSREFCHQIPNAVILVARSGCGTWSVRRAVRRLRKAKANLTGSALCPENW